MECRQAIANLALNAQLDSAPSHAQQLLLRWHNRLTHVSFSKLQELARQGRLPKQIATCEHPICSSCQMGKAHRPPVTYISKMQPIDAEDLQPGDRVSVDQMESWSMVACIQS
jgi:ATP-dependent 26S proteasome regulatory subunit